MTARLLIPDKAPAELDDDGVWSCQDPALAEVLNALYSPAHYPPSPAAGHSPYATQARVAAAATGGELQWPEIPEPTEEEKGRVY
jgi:hypothetical protein